MIKLCMQKNYFHNVKSINENKKKLSQVLNTEKKRVVDINILLNRVKKAEKNQTKKKIFLFSFMTLLLSLFVIFIMI